MPFFQDSSSSCLPAYNQREQIHSNTLPVFMFDVHNNDGCSADEISSTAESQNELAPSEFGQYDPFDEGLSTKLTELVADEQWDTTTLYTILRRDGWVSFLKNLQIYRMELISGIWRLELISYKGYVFDEQLVKELDGWGARMRKAAEFMGDQVIIDDISAYLEFREYLGVPDSMTAYTMLPYIKSNVMKRNKQIAEIECYIQEKCCKRLNV
eukprot:693256-Prorocentrum_minimum.AAC.30